jgi:hypothetical protein
MISALKNQITDHISTLVHDFKGITFAVSKSCATWALSVAKTSINNLIQHYHQLLHNIHVCLRFSIE